MHIIEKLKKIEDFFDSLIDYDKVLNCMNIVISSDAYKDNPNMAHVVHNKNDLVIRVYEPRESAIDYTNIISSGYINIFFIPSTYTLENYRSREKTNFLLQGRGYIPDSLSTETSITELEEMVFNMSVQYGTDVDINKVLIIYVLYKKYHNLVPEGNAILLSLTMESELLYHIMGIR